MIKDQESFEAALQRVADLLEHPPADGTAEDEEFGKLLHTLQLTPDTFSQTQEAHNVFSYQATAIARKVPIPQWWFDHEDLVNSEFFAQRSLFDLVMNQQLPEA